MIVYSYIIYLVVSIALTIWVARTLHRNGRIFLIEALHGNEAMADSVNHLLVVGFYLINMGYMSLALKEANTIPDTRVVIEVLSFKIGCIILILGGMHFLNLFIFFSLRKRAHTNEIK